MRNSKRALALAVAAVVGLAFSSAASAAYAPRMIVSGSSHALGSGGPVTFDIRQAETDDPTAVITIYAPLGYDVALNASPGATIGAASATVKVGTLGGAKVPVTGTVKADDPARYRNNPCTRRATPHEAVWALQVTLAGTPVTVPLFVDRVTSGPETDFASARIQVCFNSPNDPVRNPTGSQLLAARFSVNVFTNPSTRGNYRWIGVFTPYRAGTAIVNPAGTVQSQTIQALPVQLGLSARRVTRKGRAFAKLEGSLITGATRAARHPVQFMLSTRSAKNATRVFRTLRTNRRGGFFLFVPLKASKTWFRAKTVMPARRTTAGCLPPTLAIACSSVWTAPVGTRAKPLFSRQTVLVRR